MMQSYKYKRNLIDADLLDNYPNIINAPIPLYDKTYALQKTTWGRWRMALYGLPT